MKHHKLSKRSLDHIARLIPDLRQLPARALELSKYDFGIICSVRTPEVQAAKVASGASLYSKSYHLANEFGLAEAFDIAVYVNGEYSTDPKHYRKVAQAFMTAAIEQGVQIQWGGFWESLFDGPHFQINRKYPYAKK